MIINDSVHLWHVAKSGNDANTGHAAAYPVNLANDAKLTVSAAITAAAVGDTILVWPGTYNEAVSISKPLNVLGFGVGKTIIQNGTTHGVALSNSGGASGTTVKGISGITTASGVVYGLNLGFTNDDCVFEDCYFEGDYDGIHLRSSNRTQLVRCHGKGKFDGLQGGDGEGHLIRDCIAETTGENSIDNWTNAFVCNDARGLRVHNLYCKARRSLAGDNKHLAGAMVKGEAMIDGLTLDVDHSGTGDHRVVGLLVDDSSGKCTITKIQAIAKAAEGSVYGVSVENGLALIDSLFADATLTGGVGAAYGLSVTAGKELSVMKGKVGTHVQAPGVTSSVTGQVGGFEKSRFLDSALAVLPDDTLNGWTLRWANGDNEGETQVVDDFVQSGGELRFAADFTNDIQAGDDYELFLNGIPAEFSLFNSGGTLAISQLDHEPDKISGVVDYLLPVGQPGGAVDIGAVNGDTGAADLLIKASAVRANNAAQNKLTGTVTIRNNDDTTDLYSMTLDDNGQTITRTITGA